MDELPLRFAREASRIV
ncbi:hypothetical protein MKD33_07120, partial [Chromobacterium piscinae]